MDDIKLKDDEWYNEETLEELSNGKVDDDGEQQSAS